MFCRSLASRPLSAALFAVTSLVTLPALADPPAAPTSGTSGAAVSPGPSVQVWTPPPAPPAPAVHRRSKAMMVTGIVLTSAGAVLGLGGFAYSSMANDRPQSACDLQACLDASHSMAESQRMGGLVMAGIGAGLFAVGLPLAIIGGQKVTDSAAPPAPKVAVSVSPTGVLLVGSF